MSFWKRIFGGSKPVKPTNRTPPTRPCPSEVEALSPLGLEKESVEVPKPGPQGGKYWASPSDLNERPAGSFRLARDAKAYLKGLGGTIQNTQTCQITKYDASGKVIERCG
jgi:hypothetical protein